MPLLVIIMYVRAFTPYVIVYVCNIIIWYQYTDNISQRDQRKNTDNITRRDQRKNTDNITQRDQRNNTDNVTRRDQRKNTDNITQRKNILCFTLVILWPTCQFLYFSFPIIGGHRGCMVVGCGEWGVYLSELFSQ
jgi:hypothetical protein